MDVPVGRGIVGVILAGHLGLRRTPGPARLFQLGIAAEARVGGGSGHGGLLRKTAHVQNRLDSGRVPATLGNGEGEDHLLCMTRALILAAVAAPLLLASAAHAQTLPRPLPPGLSAWDQHRYQADQHRYDMDRLRLQERQRQATVRQLDLDSRLTRQNLEAQRTDDPYVPSAPRALRSPAEERTARESAGERRREVEAGVGQIDSWLDRRPN